MSEAEVHIQSYFSIETDLAKGFSEWPEFIEGKEYSVLLRSPLGEEVSMELVEEKDEGVDDIYFRVRSNINGALFQRALGLATYLLAVHSDNLMVHKWK